MIRRLGVLVLLALAALPAGANAEFRPPVPQQQTLSNGLHVAVFPRPGAGVVQVQLMVRAGVDGEGPNAGGSATLTGRMLRQGTASRTADAFAHDLGQLGGTLAISTERELTTLGAAFLPSDLESGLELLSDAVINPVFDDAQLEKARNQVAREVLQRHANPTLVAEDQLWDLALAGVPAARPPLGTLSTVFNMNREDLRAFHRDRYRADAAVLAIAGDVDPERAFSIATEYFARWTGSSTPRPAVSAPRGAPPAQLVDRKDLTRAVVRIGWRLPGRSADDDLARTIGARLLQERLESSLGARSRSPVSVSFSTVGEAGLFAIGFETPVDSVVASVRRVRRAVRDAVTRTPTAAELDALRERVLASYPLRFETLGRTMSQWLLAGLDGKEADPMLAGYPGRVAALTPAAVAAAMTRGFEADGSALVVVGPAARLHKALADLGPIEEVQLDQPPTAKSAAPADTLPPVTAQSAAEGRTWADKVVKAHGGADKLRLIHDSIMEARVTLTMQGRELRGQMRQMRLEPFKMQFLTSFQSFESRQILNGNRAWSLTNEGQLQDADSLGVRGLRSGFLSDVPHLLTSLTDPATRVESRGRAQLAGRSLQVLDVVAAGGERRRLYVDPVTAQLQAMDQNEEGGRGGGGRLTARRIYRDLRPVDGILLPFEEERQLEGQTVMRLFATRLALNTGISDTEFQRPTGGSSAGGK
jgi:predicted Zn-dependent peptidase